MESLAAALMAFGVFIAGVLVRFALLLLLVAILATPALVAVMVARGLALVRRQAVGATRAGGLLWDADLYYTPGHTWIQRKGTAVRIGLDDLAQRVLYSARTVELPQTGSTVRAGDVATVVTCGNKRAAIVSPVDGVITAVNDPVRRDPSVIHTDPYARGWLFAVTPSNARYTRLPRGETARRWLSDEGARLTQFLERNLGIATADGGDLVFPAPSLLSEEQWDALIRAFLAYGEAETVPAEPTTLGGTPAGPLPRPLVPLAAVSGAVAGGLYIVFLPVIGCALLLGFPGLWAWQHLRHAVSRVAILFSHAARRIGRDQRNKTAA